MATAKVVWRGDQWAARMQAVVDRAVTQAAGVVAGRMARNFGTEGGGVIAGGGLLNVNLPGLSKQERRRQMAIARRLKGRQRYVASPPGKFPGVRTGHLRRSVTFVGPAATGVPGKAAAGTNVAYGRFLEFGTVGFADIEGNRTVTPVVMPARPWAMRSALEAKGEAAAAFNRTFGAGMREVAREFRKEPK